MKIFAKDRYHKLMGVDKEPAGDDPEEVAAKAYANSADGNPIDEFTLGQKLLMRAAFLAGIAWARKNSKSE